MTDKPDLLQSHTPTKKGWLLFTIYFKVMLFAFTGGMAATPSLIYEITKNHKLMDEEEYLKIIALSSSLPGIIGLNNSILTGYQVAGVFGSFMAAIGTVIPAFISMLIIAIIFRELPQSKLMRGAINGIRAVSVAVLMDAGVRILVRYRKDAFGIALFMFALTLPLFTSISAFYTILLSGLIGILYYSWQHRSKDTTKRGASNG